MKTLLIKFFPSPFSYPKIISVLGLPFQIDWISPPPKKFLYPPLKMISPLRHYATAWLKQNIRRSHIHLSMILWKLKINFFFTFQSVEFPFLSFFKIKWGKKVSCEEWREKFSVWLKFVEYNVHISNISKSWYQND